MLNKENKIAIMQPYLYPYLGYFQMVHAVDKFVFYDDVNFIKSGWINRNRILINNEPKYITVELLKASTNRLINEIEIGNNQKKILSSISLAYKKAPFYKEVFPIIEAILMTPTIFISDLAIQSVKTVSEYLGLKTTFEISSQSYADTRELEREDRLIEICKRAGSNVYINAIGGMELYTKPYFKERGIELFFIKNTLPDYAQYNNNFVAGLSIIDVLMFNSKVECQNMLANYKLI